MSSSDSGRSKHRSSKAVSCITVKAGTPCFLAAARRHSRRYSRNSLLESAATGCAGGVAFGMSAPLVGIGAAIFLYFCFDRGSAPKSDNHSGKEMHTSQAPHEFHLGVSPK